MPTASKRGAPARALARNASSRVSGKKKPAHTAGRPRAASPRLEALASELRTIAGAIGIQVRQERLLREVGYHARSGLCRLGDAEILLLDHELPLDAQIDLLVGALRGRAVDDALLSSEARRLLVAG
jgi:hypothetical protein